MDEILEKDFEDLTDEEIEKIEERLEELEEEIKYEEEKMEVCGYGSSDLGYLSELQAEYEELHAKIYE